MATVEIDRDLHDLELEQLLLNSLLFHAERHSLLKKCYPALFSNEWHREIFTVIRDLNGAADIVSVGKTLLDKHYKPGHDTKVTNQMFIDLMSENNQYASNKYNPESVVSFLKDLLFRRQLSIRITNIANHIEKLNKDECRKEVSREVDKIYILERKLTRKSNLTIEMIAEKTASRVNTSSNLIKTGLSFINQKLGGLTRQSISSLLARPGHLKSTFCDNLLSKTVEFCGAKGLIISLEDPTEERVKRIVSSRLNLSLEGMRFGKVKIAQSDIEKIFKVHLHSKLVIYDSRDILTPEDAVSAINDIKPDLVCIDHIQKFQMADMVIGIIKAVNMIESSAVRNDCHILITSQVGDKEFKYRDKKDPTASDAQWNSVLYQSSAEMFGLYYPHQDTHNEFDNKYVDLSILKGRYADAVGKIRLLINPDQANIIGEAT